MEDLLTHNRSIYHIKGTNTFISIHNLYLRDIRESVVEYGSLDNVPAHISVKGMQIKALNDNLYELQNNGNEIQISINCLEFDVGNFRLSA